MTVIMIYNLSVNVTYIGKCAFSLLIAEIMPTVVLVNADNGLKFFDLEVGSGGDVEKGDKVTVYLYEAA
jgi:hypothetical protein